MRGPRTGRTWPVRRVALTGRAALLVAPILVLAACAPGALAHGLSYDVSEGAACIIRIADDHGAPFAGQGYEVFRPGETAPFQSGRTDAAGRVAFVPDVDGEWRVRAFSTDGHGLDIRLTPAVGVGAAGVSSPPLARTPRLLVGVAILFGLFGIAGMGLAWSVRRGAGRTRDPAADGRAVGGRAADGRAADGRVVGDRGAVASRR